MMQTNLISLSRWSRVFSFTRRLTLKPFLDYTCKVFFYIESLNFMVDGGYMPIDLKCSHPLTSYVCPLPTVQNSPSPALVTRN